MENLEDLKARLEECTGKEVSDDDIDDYIDANLDEILASFVSYSDDSDLDASEIGCIETYDRDSDINGPKELLKTYAQLAIDTYNEGKIESQHYSVVDIVRALIHAYSGCMVFMHLTAKQGDADAIYFQAQLWDGCACDGSDVEVMFVGPISEEEVASKRLGDNFASRWPDVQAVYRRQFQV